MNKEDGTEKTLKAEFDMSDFENIGFNETVTMYFYSKVNGYEDGRVCNGETSTNPTHYVTRKKVEIFGIMLYNENEIEETDFGEVETVRKTPLENSSLTG